MNEGISSKIGFETVPVLIKIQHLWPVFKTEGGSIFSILFGICILTLVLLVILREKAVSPEAGYRIEEEPGNEELGSNCYRNEAFGLSGLWGT